MSPLVPGGKFGDFTVVRMLGMGGMGEVWLLRSPSGLEVAVKILDAESSGNREARKRFLREAKLALDMKHPHLVETYDIGEDPETGLCYILMEYVPGGTLADHLKAHGAMPIENAVAVLQAIASVLELGRAKGIVHRDIKPANIMFAADGTPKLADLGIAHADSRDSELTTITQTGVMIGTPAYMAPEQMLDSHHVDTRADIYSLGVVFFEMLTGERPNKDDTVIQLMAKAVKGEPLPDVRTLRPEVSASLAMLLRMMVSPDRESRLSTPGQITVAIDSIRRTGKFTLPTARSMASRKPFPWKIPLFACAIAGIAAAAFFGIARKKPATPPPAVKVAEPATSTADKKRQTGQNVTKDLRTRHATANGLTWCYTLENGKAVIERGEWGSSAVGSAPRGNVVVPSRLNGHDVVAIGKGAFSHCDAMVSATISEGIEEIRSWAFYYCGNLSKVSLPSSLKRINSIAFCSCRNLNSFDVGECPSIIGDAFGPYAYRVLVSESNPSYAEVDGIVYSKDKSVIVFVPRDREEVKPLSTVREVGVSSFRDCKVRRISLPPHVKRICKSAFNCCYFLESIDLPDGLREIESRAFDCCYKLQCISFPASLERLGSAAFDKCKGLMQLRFAGDAPIMDFTRGSALGETPTSLEVVVQRGSRGWKSPGSGTLPDKWPDGGFADSRRIRFHDEKSLVNDKVRANTGAWQPGPSDLWLVEWDKALAMARNTGKRLFVLNTGYDWCHWCRKLRAEVLDKPEFVEFAAQNLVPLYLDSPRRNPLCNEQRTHNREIVKALGFRGGVPNAEIFTADGKKLGGVSGGGLALGPYIDRIRQALSNDGEPVSGDKGKMLFDEGYAKLAATVAEERAKIPPAAKEDFKAQLTGVAVCDAKTRKFDDLRFLPPATHLEVAPGKMAVFRVEHDFPQGYAAAVWVTGKGRFYSNPSGRYPGKGVKYGFLRLHNANQDVRLDSIDIRTNSEPELDDQPRGWTICSPKVDIVFSAQMEKADSNREDDDAANAQTATATRKIVLIQRLDRDPKAWAYSFDEEPGWEKPDFDDSTWKRAPGGFGRREDLKQLNHARLNTEWRTKRLFLRKRFTWNGDGNVSRAVADAYHDDDATFYLNGQMLTTVGYANSDWQPFEMPASRFAAAVRKGENVLCVEVRNASHCQYFDCGLVVECGGRPTANAGANFMRKVKTGAGTWTVVVENGVAQLGDGRNVALEPQPKGQLKIPSELDGIAIHRLARDSFIRCEELESVEIAEGIRSIGEGSFYGCRQLSKVSLPSTLEHIGHKAFLGAAMNSIDLKAVRLIEYGAFNLCDRLETLKVNLDNVNFRVKDGVLYDRIRRAVVFCPRSRKSYSLPSGIEEIYECAFHRCQLKSVVIPGTVAHIGHDAFKECPLLESVRFNGDDVIIHGGAFADTPALKNVTLPKRLKALDDWAIFCRAGQLESISLPDTVEIIDDAVFECCPRLKKVSLGQSLRSVRHHAFAGCKNLAFVAFPPTLKEMGAEVFLDCSGLKSVSFAGDAPNLRDQGAVRFGRDLYKGANKSLATIVPKGSRGWKDDSDKLPKYWPADGGESARQIRHGR